MKFCFSSITVLVLALVTGACEPIAPTKPASNSSKMKCESHGSFVHCKLHDANRRHVSLHSEASQNKCFKGSSWGTDSNGIWVNNKCKGIFYYRNDKGYHADYQKQHKHHGGQSGTCPSGLRGNECAYYKDGYKAGKQDGKASMSRNYQRHSKAYDSRFKKYFARGYKAGWNNYR